jgi:hypothetical protein
MKQNNDDKKVSQKVKNLRVTLVLQGVHDIMKKDGSDNHGQEERGSDRQRQRGQTSSTGAATTAPASDSRKHLALIEQVDDLSSTSRALYQPNVVTRINPEFL